MFNCDERYGLISSDNLSTITDGYSAAYGGTALAFRDRLIIDWNKTQQRQTFADQKRLYCMCISKPAAFRPNRSTDLSLEFLMGRALDNAMLNVGLKNVAKGMWTSMFF